MLITIIVLVIAAFVVWLGTGAVEGYLDAKQRPTQPMELCHVHGPFLKKHALDFMDISVCPRCYQDSWKKVEKQL